MEIECYAQRLLNPFRGVVHTIRYRSAEAVTTDGLEWDIYVANDALVADLGRAGRRAQISDIRYGHWSAEKGLKRGPLYPSDDFKRLEAMGAVVFQHLRQVYRDVPFAFRDRFELWLLDHDNLPLALLHSVHSESETDTRPPLDWRAGMRAAESFRSAAFAHTAEIPDAPATPAAALTVCVNAHSAGAVQWFLRSDDGSGLGLAVLHGPPALSGRLLDPEWFPPLFIATRGMEATQVQLVRDYHAWQAPWLLLLPDLSEATRRSLEAAACEHGELVEQQVRLYPQVHDRPALQAARVAAALARHQPTPPGGDPAIASFYIELDSPESGG